MQNFQWTQMYEKFLKDGKWEKWNHNKKSSQNMQSVFLLEKLEAVTRELHIQV